MLGLLNCPCIIEPDGYFSPILHQEEFLLLNAISFVPVFTYKKGWYILCNLLFTYVFHMNDLVTNVK